MELRGQLSGPASQISGPPVTDDDAGRLLNELLGVRAARGSHDDAR
jgi:hypothetical protein